MRKKPNYEKRNKERHYRNKATTSNLPGYMNMSVSRACVTGKTQYITRSDAKKVARRAKELNGERRAMTAYICKHCGYFHIGHSRSLSY